MASGIILPIDRIFSLAKCWHGVEIIPASGVIGDDELNQLRFKIRKGEIKVDISQNGEIQLPPNLRDEMFHLAYNLGLPVTHFAELSDEQLSEAAQVLFKSLGAVLNSNLVKMEEYAPLIADYRICRPDLCGTPNELVPLHVPKKSYTEIDNGSIIDAVQAFVKEYGFKIATAGTLEAGKKFFMSVQTDDSEWSLENGEDFSSLFNFVTSHDGTMGFQVFDCMIRIVCMNTLRWALAAKGDLSITTYHTSKAAEFVSKLPDILKATLDNRAVFRRFMNELCGISISRVEAQNLIAGYFTSLADVETSDESPIIITDDADKKETKKALRKSNKVLSTRMYNQIEGIYTLFCMGKGNHGQTLADVLNGATEYWTSGDGTGKDSQRIEKAYKAQFGQAAQHKMRFAEMLRGDAASLDLLKEQGAKALDTYRKLS